MSFLQTAQSVRIIVQQPALPRYRIPVFRDWAARDGIELQVVYSMGPPDLESGSAEGFSAVCVPMWRRNFGARKVVWHSAQWQSARHAACDVLVLAWDVQYLSLIPALLRARLNGIRTLLWGHGFSKKEAALRRFIRNTVGRMADGLIFYDPVTAERFRAEGWSAEKIYVAVNALDQSSIQHARAAWLNDPERLHVFQREHGLADRINLIYLGRIYQENRLDLLINALPAIQRRHPKVQLLVLGSDSSEVQNLKALAERLGVAECIKWIGAVYDEDKIAPYMLSSNLFCYPANIGLSIMHAMGYGLPVVTGNDLSSHNPEIHVLKDGENGRLFRHLDVEDLSRTVAHLLDHAEETAAMGSSAREWVIHRYSVQHMVDGFMSAVEGVMKGKPA